MVREDSPVPNWAASQLREKADKVFMCLTISILANSLVTLARPECWKLEVLYNCYKRTSHA